MARVNVDQVALTDGRFARLAQLRGWTDADHARGKMLLVWNETIHRGSTLPVWLIDHHLGAGAAGDLLEAQLAELVTLAGEVAGVPAGGTLLRVKGCAGRSDYLEKKLNAAQAGGKARSASAQRVAGRFTSQRHQPVAGNDTSAPAPAPAPDKEEDLSAPAAPETRPNRKPKNSKAQVPADWLPVDALGLSVAEREQLARFRDHHRSKGNTFADVDAAWRNWKRRAPEFTPFSSAAPKSQKAPAPDDDEPRLGHLLNLGASS